MEDIKNKIFIKKDGVTTVINNGTPELAKTIVSINNPCADCECGYVTKCPKMADEHKKNISEYEYITDGYQVYDRDGECSALAIVKCSNYVEQKRAANIPRNKKTANLLILRYGGVDLDEACRIRDYTLRCDRERAAREALEELQEESRKTR